MPVVKFLLKKVQGILHISYFFLDKYIANNAVYISLFIMYTLLITFSCPFKKDINHIFCQNFTQLVWRKIPLIITHKFLQLVRMYFNLEIFGY